MTTLLDAASILKAARHPASPNDFLAECPACHCNTLRIGAGPKGNIVIECAKCPNGRAAAWDAINRAMTPKPPEPVMPSLPNPVPRPTPDPPQAKAELNRELAGLPTTDMGNAERLVQRFCADLRFCHSFGKWVIYNGKYWQINVSGAAMRLAKQTIRLIHAEIATINVQDDDADKQRVKELTNWAKKSEAKERLMAMLKLAESEAEVSVTSDALERGRVAAEREQRNPRPANRNPAPA